MSWWLCTIVLAVGPGGRCGRAADNGTTHSSRGCTSTCRSACTYLISTDMCCTTARSGGARVHQRISILRICRMRRIMYAMLHYMCRDRVLSIHWTLRSLRSFPVPLPRTTALPLTTSLKRSKSLSPPILPWQHLMKRRCSEPVGPQPRKIGPRRTRTSPLPAPARERISPYLMSTGKVMEGHGRPWKAMEFHGIPWKAMEGHGRSWKVMEGHGRSWKAMEGHGRQWKAYGRPWKVMEHPPIPDEQARPRRRWYV